MNELTKKLLDTKVSFGTSLYSKFDEQMSFQEVFNTLSIKDYNDRSATLHDVTTLCNDISFNHNYNKSTFAKCYKVMYDDCKKQTFCITSSATFKPNTDKDHKTCRYGNNVEKTTNVMCIEWDDMPIEESNKVLEMLRSHKNVFYASRSLSYSGIWCLFVYDTSITVDKTTHPLLFNEYKIILDKYVGYTSDVANKDITRTRIIAFDNDFKYNENVEAYKDSKIDNSILLKIDLSTINTQKIYDNDQYEYIDFSDKRRELFLEKQVERYGNDSDFNRGSDKTYNNQALRVVGFLSRCGFTCEELVSKFSVLGHPGLLKSIEYIYSKYGHQHFNTTPLRYHVKKEIKKDIDYLNSDIIESLKSSGKPVILDAATALGKTTAAISYSKKNLTFLVSPFIITRDDQQYRATKMGMSSSNILNFKCEKDLDINELDKQKDCKLVLMSTEKYKRLTVDKAYDNLYITPTLTVIDEFHTLFEHSIEEDNIKFKDKNILLESIINGDKSIIGMSGTVNEYMKSLIPSESYDKKNKSRSLKINLVNSNTPESSMIELARHSNRALIRLNDVDKCIQVTDLTNDSGYVCSDQNKRSDCKNQRDNIINRSDISDKLFATKSLDAGLDINNKIENVFVSGYEIENICQFLVRERQNDITFNIVNRFNFEKEFNQEDIYEYENKLEDWIYKRNESIEEFIQQKHISDQVSEDTFENMFDIFNSEKMISKNGRDLYNNLLFKDKDYNHHINYTFINQLFCNYRKSLLQENYHLLIHEIKKYAGRIFNIEKIEIKTTTERIRLVNDNIQFSYRDFFNRLNVYDINKNERIRFIDATYDNVRDLGDSIKEGYNSSNNKNISDSKCLKKIINELKRDNENMCFYKALSYFKEEDEYRDFRNINLTRLIEEIRSSIDLSNNEQLFKDVINFMQALYNKRLDETGFLSRRDLVINIKHKFNIDWILIEKKINILIDMSGIEVVEGAVGAAVGGAIKPITIQKRQFLEDCLNYCKLKNEKLKMSTITDYINENQNPFFTIETKKYLYTNIKTKLNKLQ